MADERKDRGWVSIGEAARNVLGPMRTCIIRGCGKPVPQVKARDLPRWLCDEHYAPVSDERINDWIEQQLKKARKTAG